MFQAKNWTTEKKLEYGMERHKELHTMYEMISMLCIVCLRKKIPLIIENPVTQPHYLTNYWSIKPTIIDQDRTRNGDCFKKPTQYFFIGIEPKHNFIFEPLEYVEPRNIERQKAGEKSRQVLRSMIHPQYANRFIREYILECIGGNNEEYNNNPSIGRA